MALITRKKKQDKIEKKTFRLKLLELCKTRTKSSPDMFNFCVDLAGHDMVIDAGRATKRRRKFKAPWLQTKVQRRTFRDHGFQRENSLKITEEKKIENKTLDLPKNPVEQTAPKYINWIWPL